MDAQRRVRSYDRALLNCLVMQRDLADEICRRRHSRVEAVGQKSDGEREETAE